MADEVGEDKEMDDKERMKDLAPVSLWQARRQEKEFTRYNFRTSTMHLELLPLISTAERSTKVQGSTYATTMRSN